ncbi:MAG: hypothetical protein ABI091_10855 [Ferruginibacter sp.]
MFLHTKRMSIPVFAINLKSRTDRKQHVLQQFYQKEEFDVQCIEACKHRNGAIGLWKSIIYILQNLVNAESDYVIICEDDHEFTNGYNKEYLFKCIDEARENNVDVLLGGVSWFTTMIEVSEKLFWVEKFTGTQFTILFRKFFKSILEADFGNNDSADYKMCSLTENKFFMYPFISVQKDFGYSDATSKNNAEGRVSELFNNSVESVSILKKVNAFYQNNKAKTQLQFYDTITLPTYVVTSPECSECRVHIEKQFAKRNEFDVIMVDSVKHKILTLSLWLSIRKVIETAIENDDDVIVISTSDHEFTEDYSRDLFIQNIIESNEEAVDYLSGGTDNFRVALPVSKNKYWINPCMSIQFIVVYKRFFEKILNEPFDENVIAADLLSEMTSNKLVMFPFISVKKDLGHPCSFDGGNIFSISHADQFAESSRRLGNIRSAYLKYQENTF